MRKGDAIGIFILAGTSFNAIYIDFKILYSINLYKNIYIIVGYRI
jgi:hypothetical protein